MEKQTGQQIYIETVRDSQLIDPQDILCCYISERNTMIELISGDTLVTRYSLKYLEEVKVREIRTLRCHAKNLVSLEHRIVYNSGFRKIILCNGQELKVAKDKKKLVEKALKDFTGPIPKKKNEHKTGLGSKLTGLTVILTGLGSKIIGLGFSISERY